MLASMHVAFRYAITRNNETGYPERNKLITRSNNPQLFIRSPARGEHGHDPAKIFIN